VRDFSLENSQENEKIREEDFLKAKCHEITLGLQFSKKEDFLQGNSLVIFIDIFKSQVF